MNKNTTILLGAVAIIAIGVGVYVSMSSPSNESWSWFKTQSVNWFAPLVINDGTRWWLERYFDIPCNDSWKLDISAFTSMINNPEKCQCVSKYETKFNIQWTARIWLLWTDGIRYPATKAKYEELCPEWRFIAEQNGDLYMIGQCANAVALWYWSHNNPENIYSFNDFQTTCSEWWIWDSCENNSQCESWYCEQTTVSKCLSRSDLWKEYISCAWFTTEEQCLWFKQNVWILTWSNNWWLVSVCEWQTTTSGICAEKNDDYNCQFFNANKGLFDYNDDWLINWGDINFLQNIILGIRSPKAWKIYDLNKNWWITTFDILLYQKLINECNSSICWNLNIENFEECDDWNNVNWDGCSAACAIEKPNNVYCDVDKDTYFAKTSVPTNSTSWYPYVTIQSNWLYEYCSSIVCYINISCQENPWNDCDDNDKNVQECPWICGDWILDQWEQCDGVWQAQCGKWATCSTTWKAPCTCQYSEVIGPDKLPDTTNSDGDGKTEPTQWNIQLPTTRALTR